jgi:hypothetical protein
MHRPSEITRIDYAFRGWPMIALSTAFRAYIRAGIILYGIGIGTVFGQQNAAATSNTSSEESPFFELADRKAKLVGEIAELTQRIADAKRKLPTVKSGEETIADKKAEMRKVLDDIAKFENNRETKTQEVLAQEERAGLKKTRLEQEILALQTNLEGNTASSLQAGIANDESTLKAKLVEQQDVERKIRQIRTPAQDFKTNLSLTFAALIAFVIVGFFVISYKDDKVRSAIFAGQSGIQFLTLFSLVIAIILFGITGILEGKELAALLGGLSGYILGRTDAR